MTFISLSFVKSSSLLSPFGSSSLDDSTFSKISERVVKNLSQDVESGPEGGSGGEGKVEGYTREWRKGCFPGTFKALKSEMHLATSQDLKMRCV